MKWMISMLVIGAGFLRAGEMEVRSYQVSLSNLELAYERSQSRDGEGEPDPFDTSGDGGIKPIESLRGELVDEAGFESRFLEGVEVIRDCTSMIGELVGRAEFKGRAVYDVKGGRLIVRGDGNVHRDIRTKIEEEMLLSVMTEVLFYEMIGIGEGREARIWEETPKNAKLVAGVSCVTLPGLFYSANSTTGQVMLEGEVQLDEGYVENRMTVRLNLPDGVFSWKTGLVIPVGVRWAEVIGSVDGKSTLVMVVKQDVVTDTGLLLDEWILKEEEGAFLRDERLEEMRWRDPEKKQKRDMTKPFHEFEAPPSFDVFLFQRWPEYRKIEKEKYPELRGMEGACFGFQELLEKNGVAFREGDFVVYSLRSEKFLAKLSEDNLEVFEDIVIASMGIDAPRMIRVSFTEVQGADSRNQEVLRRVAMLSLPGQSATAKLGQDLEFEVEAQIDGEDEMIEMKTTLWKESGEATRPLFKTDLVLSNGRTMIVQESVLKGEKRKWLVQAKMVNLPVEVDELLKRRKK